MAPRRLLLAVLAYGALNAILYAGLLPLWDGFDEPFHYAYVSRLWREQRWPRVGTATLSEEIAESLELAPGSYLVKRNIPAVIPFNDYFTRTDAERKELRRRLEHIDPRRAAVPGGGFNYEAQQAPLAYVLLAPFDMLWRDTSLVDRILRLRIFCGLLSAIATGLLVYRLGGQIGLGDRWRASAVYLALSSQVFYAATAHVANDWLAVPLFTALIVCAISLWDTPTPRKAAWFAAVFAAGLLTKAYFLSVAPGVAIFAVLLVWRRRLPWGRAGLYAAVPLLLAIAWYARNVVLYRDVSGILQTEGGIPVGRLLQAAVRMPWLKSLQVTIATSLWFGNSSATHFSAKTTAFLSILLVAAGLLYAGTLRRRWWPAAERILVAALLCYSAGLGYSALLHFLTTNAGMFWAAPWYTQLLFPPGLCLIMAGLARAGRVGEWVRVAMLAGWGYLMAATYVAKLIPQYAGYAAERIHFSELLHWYRESLAGADRVLATVALIPPGAIWGLTAIVVASALGLALALSLRFSA